VDLPRTSGMLGAGIPPETLRGVTIRMMRAHRWVALAMLVMGAACPFEFGEGGRIDQAIAKDSKPGRFECPAGTHIEKADPHCTKPPCSESCVADRP